MRAGMLLCGGRTRSAADVRLREHHDQTGQARLGIPIPDTAPVAVCNSLRLAGVDPAGVGRRRRLFQELSR